MSKPIILAVDDDPPVLASVQRDLRSRYAETYRVMAAPGGPQGLSIVEELKRRGDNVALFLVDQRMPEIEGIDLLERALPFFPNAKRVLLTAYADTEAAITAINKVGLDHYLMKPWDPPEDTLYPVLDDLLSDWLASNPPSFDGIRILGQRWSPLTYELKDFLALNRIPYRFLDVERESEAVALLEALGDVELPAVTFPDGSSLSRPDRTTMAERIGMQVTAGADLYDLTIIGAGPAGLAAAVYGASEGLRTAVVERQATGGQAGTSSRIENYLGFPNGISGSDLARRAHAQARKFGAEVLTAVEATGIRVDGPMKVVELSNGTEITSKAVLITSGMTVRKLNVPGYERFSGAGVYYGASVSEAAHFQDDEVFVIGGANSAGQGAMMFSRFASKVTMVVRADSLGEKMSQYLVDQIEATPNIEVLTGTQVIEVLGDDHVEQIVLKTDGQQRSVPAAGIFIFVGAVPHTAFLEGVVAMNRQGFILTGSDLMVDGKRPKGWPLDRDPYLQETSVPGIFAAGDVRHGVIRRVASAVGQGSVCISFIHEYLASI